ncbi:hypothetical protein Leryth_023801 [Lithospermum erythrorhizon]|nr:hypothetical protein Leryth_023801 [Lithospermum erythrorhizon]
MKSTFSISSKLLLFLAVLHHLPPEYSSSPPPPIFPKEAQPTKSGYLTVNQTTGSSMFYAFYEAQESNSTSVSNTPLVIWLQGGPGCSSMIGNLYELGPWRVSSSLRQNVEHLELKKNPGPWNRLFGVVFLDNPIGTGFSIAASESEIPRNQHEVAKHLWNAMKEFIALDLSFKTRPIYFTGESYAGKYVPAIGYYALKRNAQLPKEMQLNVQGVAIGNGLTHPIAQVATHAINAYYIGLINEKQKVLLENLQEKAVGFTKAGNWSDATIARSKVLNELQNMTGLATLYDYRRLIPYEDDLVGDLLNIDEVKKLFGANETIKYATCSGLVGEILSDDVMKSAKYKVEYLVKNSKVLLYQGQNDLRDGVVSTEAWMKMMKWEGTEKFLEAERKVWKVKGFLAGYVQKWGSLSHVIVSNAGHLVPTDEAVNSQAMIEDWILEKGLFAEDEGIMRHPSANRFKGF